MSKIVESLETLRENEERLREIVNCLPFPVAIYNEVGDFLTLNPAWCRLSGYTQQQLPNIESWIFHASRQPSEVARKLMLDNFKLSEMTYKRERQLITASGEECIWDLYSGPIGKDREGRRLVITTAVDVTERKRAEKALHEREEELARLNTRKDEFLATLAHELRNPLAPIRTGLQVMQMMGGYSESLEKVRLMMERQTLQLVSLVDDLMEVSRITRGKLELRKARVSIGELINSAIEASRPLMEEAKHRLLVEIPPKDLCLDADPCRLTQVLSNLLNNAAQYTPTGGTISVFTQVAGNNLLISVSDTGVGIPAHMLAHIFEPFAQIKHPTKNGYEGLGIGLTLVKTLMELHGGSITAESKGENQGSTFTLQLPCVVRNELKEESVEKKPFKVNHSSGNRVLVVDDNKTAADLLSMEIAMLGNDVRTAGDGEKAYEVAAEFNPDIIFMDLGMPTMNGFEATSAIREQQWGKKIKIFALSGWGQEDDQRQTRAKGFDGHLVKPVEPAVLEEILASLGNAKTGQRL